MSTEVAVRSSGFDLTRAPQERWNEEMVKVVARNVFRGKEITEAQLYYCLSVAESLELNPMIEEIYFLPAKSKDAAGPAWKPYIGRNGLVAKAERAGHYYEAETVHERDRFRMTRKKDGTVEVTHSYTQADRGEIVGAYAFLHDRTGRERPAFFYAKLSEYLPEFDADWKMSKSPWGNQRSAMIEKCAMIGAGRKRLRLGNVLGDGEIARVEQMQEITGPPASDAVTGDFDWAALEERVGSDPVERLRDALERLHELDEHAWPPAKLEMVTGGMGTAEVLELAAVIEGELDMMFAGAQSRSPEPQAEPDPPPAEGPRSAGAAAEGGAGREIDGEAVTDAEVVPDAERPPAEMVEGWRRRMAEIEATDPATLSDRQHDELEQEWGKLRERIAGADPDQGKLL